MKILLDECVPANFAKHLIGHECATVPSIRLAGMKNGELLTAAQRLGFQVFLTIDQGLAYQQQLRHRTIAVMILRPKTSRLADLLSLLPDCLSRLQLVKPGDLEVI
jgi:hypothetical protein